MFLGSRDRNERGVSSPEMEDFRISLAGLQKSSVRGPGFRCAEVVSDGLYQSFGVVKLCILIGDWFSTECNPSIT